LALRLRRQIKINILEHAHFVPNEIPLQASGWRNSTWANYVKLADFDGNPK
jgi:hypothetical protein